MATSVLAIPCTVAVVRVVHDTLRLADTISVANAVSVSPDVYAKVGAWGTAIAALGALGALFFSARSARAAGIAANAASESAAATSKVANATIDNYRKMTTPHITFCVYQDYTEPPTGLSVRNNGIGPAVVTSVQIEADGQIFDGTERDGMRAALGKVAPDLLSYPVGVKYIGTGVYIMPDQELYLVRSPGKAALARYIDGLDLGTVCSKVGVAVGCLTLTLKYESIYGDKFSARIGASVERTSPLAAGTAADGSTQKDKTE